MLLLALLMLAFQACDPTGINNLNADELKKLINSGEKLLIVDTRSEYEYTQGHIPKAILISQEKVSIAYRFLPDNKDIILVFYCRGAG